MFNNTQQQEIHIKNISKLNCGHKFHHNWLEEFKIVECLICLKKKDPLFSGENAIIIWDIQQNIYPKLKSYNYNNIFQVQKVKETVDTYGEGGIS